MSIRHNELYKALMRAKKEYDPLNPPCYAEKRKKASEYMPVKDPDIRVWTIAEPRIRGELLMNIDNPEYSIVMYIHGGGFTSERAESRRDICSWFTRHGYNSISVNYRLAPDHAFPEGLEDCLDFYEYLLEAYAPQHISVIGDGAGANLAVAMTLLAHDQGLPLPAAVAAISPVTQMEKMNSSYAENNDRDCRVGISSFKEVRDVYLGNDENSRSPYASIVFGSYKDFSPLYITCSDTECLRDDAAQLYEAAVKDGAECVLKTYSNMMHSFPIFTDIEESEDALQDILQFIQSHMGK